jgi:hypothetical protein
MDNLLKFIYGLSLDEKIMAILEHVNYLNTNHGYPLVKVEYIKDMMSEELIKNIAYLSLAPRFEIFDYKNKIQYTPSIGAIETNFLESNGEKIVLYMIREIHPPNKNKWNIRIYPIDFLTRELLEIEREEKIDVIIE